ncbi:CRISPR-associated endonuclease Cas1 [Flaviflexus massiliensis]|uniref:CRISPR-associated endonuclease Cas1 n=1 Tax=Flaviflexus massiliensis TaxID=1522309 RepID=UPI000A66FAD3|nr:CRISPR-associated endonuclease Cas1 [Flaviflexus massiliensis]
MNPIESISAPESVPISLVAHTLYCERRTWLEAVGERAKHSYAMRVGDADHKRTHNPSASNQNQLRGIDIHDDSNGFHGRIDTADILPNGALKLIEYKSTPVRFKPSVTKATRIQLALQTIALEKAGYEVAEHSVFFKTHHRHVPVEIDEVDREEALSAVARTQEIILGSEAPPALIDDPRCSRCSHVSVCLPDERRGQQDLHQIRASDPAGQALHLSTYGARASLKDGRVIVQKSGEDLASIPIEQVSAVIVHGNVDLSSALQRELLWRDIVIVWCSYGGRVTGWSRSSYSPNGLPRVQQHVASFEGRLGLAREFISSKISNQATLLRRYTKTSSTIKEMRTLQKQAMEALTIGELFGIEGNAAGMYFSNFQECFNEIAKEQLKEFPGRVGRGARDPLNICLNYSYALLQSEVLRAVVACGLDPHAGFLHSSNRNKPALTLDLMEEFRAPVADSVVIGAFNNGEISADRFHHIDGAYRLDDVSRKALIAAFERRVATEFRHPVFGYQVSWRRAMEIQARMVLGYLDGTQSQYIGVKIR